MLCDKKELDQLFEKATAATEASISKIGTTSRDKIINDELRLLLTTLSASASAQLEILKIFRSEIEAVT